MNDIDEQQRRLIGEALRLLHEEYLQNEPFNDYLDSEEMIRVGSLEFPVSQVTFWLDRDAYYNDLNVWLDETLKEKHASTIKLLKDSKQLAVFFELVDSISRNRIIPFVGAGLCKPMEMPLWKEALMELNAEINITSSNEILQLIDSGDYLIAAEKLAASSSLKVDSFIRTKYRIHSVKGALKELPKIANGCVVTTNFDNAIEKVYEVSGISFDGHMYGKEEHNFFPRLAKGERCLLKLHGDAQNNRTYILTDEQYKRAYGAQIDFKLPLPKALRQIYISSTLLFLGCSLEKDRTLDLFKQVKEGEDYEVPLHFAILPKPVEQSKVREKENLLLSINIQPIWYPDEQHQFVEDILALLSDVSQKRLNLQETERKV
ncbi:SIR2 family protein [Leptospira bourretii]|uniref:SIR2 family protein n=1 Tax=Leptospira bourretii TaxID=2484962 RepID=A0A4R9IIG6_9LEPT|nr:SIR2 family protein [Leptospira bourretii]TGK88241.1 SIR2 family protein [Leptospira bourretii]TGK88891.1 SIR2 family protein [Leptospira bourretii]TGL37941.1 SIR2 family protein [Leptospira bourretii]